MLYIQRLLFRSRRMIAHKHSQNKATVTQRRINVPTFGLGPGYFRLGDAREPTTYGSDESAAQIHADICERVRLCYGTLKLLISPLNPAFA